MSTTLIDWAGELQEAIWDESSRFGLELKASDQVAVARAVTSQPVEAVEPADIQAAFQQLDLPRPSDAFARAVIQSVRGRRQRPSLMEVLLNYRRFAIRSLSSQFGGRTTGREEELRNNLLTYLPTRGYTEARTGKGRTDILIPAPTDGLIEVKVWTNRSTYDDGVEELRRYIYTEDPSEAFMVVFGDREPLPSIVDSYEQPTAPDLALEMLTVPVIVVPFEVDPPSKAASKERKRRRGK